MHAAGKHRRGEVVPMVVAAVIAAVGIASLVFMEIGLKGDIQRHGIGMITTAVVDRAGATALPSDPKIQPAIQNRSTFFESSTR
jgi:hypothetical protein